MNRRETILGLLVASLFRRFPKRGAAQVLEWNEITWPRAPVASVFTPSAAYGRIPMWSAEKKST